jgi:hypothetical protein
VNFSALLIRLRKMVRTIFKSPKASVAESILFATKMFFFVKWV